MTAALTVPVTGTSVAASGASAGGIGDALASIFKDPTVQTSVGGAIGSIVNAGLSGIGLGGPSAEQQAAQAAAEKAAKDAETQQMLIIGGGVALVVVVVVIVVVMRRS